MSRIDLHPGTAVITGAAHGIGAAFAHQLAATQKRLLLVDKDAGALESMVESLAGSGPAEIETLPVNLACREDQDRVVERIEQGEGLSLLINNAGFGDPILFHEQDPQNQQDMLQVHVVSTVRFCRAALPGMERLGRGHIINVSSMAAGLCVPGNVMYGATKGFLHTFSEILRSECAALGVNVQLLSPGYTRTEFHNTPNYEQQDVGGRVPGWLWSPAEDVARISLRALRKGKFLCVPGRYNRSMHFFLRSRLVPKWIVRWLLA